MKTILRSPDTEVSSGSETTESAEQQLFEGAEAAPSTETTSTETPEAAAETTTAAPASTTGLTKDDVQAILTGALEQAGKSAAVPATATPAKEWTKDDFDKAFNVLKVSPEMLAQLRHENPVEALKAFEQLRDGLVRQAMTMAEYRMQQLVKELRDNDLSPVQQFVSEQRAVSFRNDFFKANPDLEKYEQLVDKVATALAAKGVTGTREQMMEHYNKETRQLLASLTAANGNGATAATTKTNGGVTTPATRRMSTLTGGGQSTGGGKAGTAAPKGPSGIEVFD